MTAAQQAAVLTAQNAFFQAEATASSAQQASAQAEANVEAAKTYATVTAPAQAQALVKGANDAYFKAQADQQNIIAVAQKAQADLSQAQINLNAAIAASLQTPGAVEQVQPPVLTPQPGPQPILPTPQV